MRVGIIGTGAISYKHAEAYRNIGFEITVCTDSSAEAGRKFAQATGAEFVGTAEKLCRDPKVDYVDVCAPPSYRLPAVQLCAANRKHVLVQKPIATNLETARQMIRIARAAQIQLGVMSMYRFADSILFLKKAISEGRLGKILEADAYVKWYRSAEYYSRPVKGSWAGEGGGALINQGIHQVDLLLYLIGAVNEVFAYWQLGAIHAIEAEDSVSALLRYACGATGVIQASTALWPGCPERLEISGSKGTAIVTAGNLTAWDVQDDAGADAPLTCAGDSGASDPMAISVAPFEREFLDFAAACNTGGAPASSGEDGFRALELIRGIYDSCINGCKIPLAGERL